MFMLLAAAPEPGAREMIRPYVEWVALGIEAVGIAIIAVGGVCALIVFARDTWTKQASPYHQLRETLGRSILLGLEFLVAADIVGTVIIDPTLYNAGVLAVIVAIRTFLSWSLEVELNGRWPWQGKAHTDK
ncbi:MAG: DUF1622 domain-containing protein [Phycisphaerae bacterium]